MDTKTTSWVSYVTFIGWIIAYVAGDKEGAKFHLNQSLVIWIAYLIISVGGAILALIPILGWLVLAAAHVFLFVMWIMGLLAAINQEERELPLIGQIRLLQ